MAGVRGWVASVIGDFVGVDGDLAGDVDDGFHAHVGVAQEVDGLLGDDWSDAFEPGDPAAVAGEGVLGEVDVEGGRWEQLVRVDSDRLHEPGGVTGRWRGVVGVVGRWVHVGFTYGLLALVFCGWVFRVGRLGCGCRWRTAGGGGVDLRVVLEQRECAGGVGQDPDGFGVADVDRVHGSEVSRWLVWTSTQWACSADRSAALTRFAT